MFHRFILSFPLVRFKRHFIAYLALRALQLQDSRHILAALFFKHLQVYRSFRKLEQPFIYDPLTTFFLLPISFFLTLVVTYVVYNFDKLGDGLVARGESERQHFVGSVGWLSGITKGPEQGRLANQYQQFQAQLHS